MFLITIRVTNTQKTFKMERNDVKMIWTTCKLSRNDKVYLTTVGSLQLRARVTAFCGVKIIQVQLLLEEHRIFPE